MQGPAGELPEEHCILCQIRKLYGQDFWVNRPKPRRLQVRIRWGLVLVSVIPEALHAAQSSRSWLSSGVLKACGSWQSCVCCIGLREVSVHPWPLRRRRPSSHHLAIRQQEKCDSSTTLVMTSKVIRAVTNTRNTVRNHHSHQRRVVVIVQPPHCHRTCTLNVIVVSLATISPQAIQSTLSFRSHSKHSSRCDRA